MQYPTQACWVLFVAEIAGVSRFCRLEHVPSVDHSSTQNAQVATILFNVGLLAQT